MTSAGATQSICAIGAATQAAYQKRWKVCTKMMNQGENNETADPPGLYKLGGVAAFIVVVLTVGEVIAFTFYPQPSTVREWFLLFQSNRLIGFRSCFSKAQPPS
jgi:hypothetical protein